MFSRAAAFLSSAHVRIDDELAHARRTLAVRDVGQDVMEVLDLLDSRLVLHNTPCFGSVLMWGANKKYDVSRRPILAEHSELELVHPGQDDEWCLTSGRGKLLEIAE